MTWSGKVLFLAALAAATPLPQFAAAPELPLRFGAPPDALVTREARSYQRIPIPVPEGIVLEVSGILPIENQAVLVTTRHGEIWRIDGLYEADPHPRFTQFAAGLHEPLGIIRAPQGGYYVAQREEVTRIADTHGTGRADHFETVARFPVDGSYHEYAYGPVIGPNGNLRVTLNVAFSMKTQSPVPWRGWMMEILPDGSLRPIAAGLRSPAGFILNAKQEWLYVDNQGEWVGADKVSEIHEGDFLGHPASLVWSHLPGSPVHLTRDDIPDTGEPLHEASRAVRGGIRLPAVWFPYAIMGISSDSMVESDGGAAFGPFAHQYFVGDQGQSKVMRMTLERVNGVLQGACYSFVSGFDCGIIRLAWGEDHSLLVGESNRGWGSIGPKSEGLERLVWKGSAPFEIKEVTAEPDGFKVSFTAPVDPRSAADVKTYALTSFTYRYHHYYGSPIINAAPAPVAAAVVAPDHLSVRLAVAGLRQYYIHEIKTPGIRREGDAATLVHDTAYYTLNEIPHGEGIVAPAELTRLAAQAAAAATVTSSAASPKHPLELPITWGGSVDDVIKLETRSGLKFEPAEFTVKAGDKVSVILHNGDDMLHNWVLTAPAKGPTVGALALTLGLDGPARNYIPDSPDVLYHTLLLQPGGTDTIYFSAPKEPGDYDFICSFPGHYMLMHGVMHVIPAPAGP